MALLSTFMPDAHIALNGYFALNENAYIGLSLSPYSIAKVFDADTSEYVYKFLYEKYLADRELFPLL
jgi:hypothetical protein